MSHAHVSHVHLNDLFLLIFRTRVHVQVLYPVLMFVMVSRTLFNNVRPDDMIVFKPRANDDESTSSTNVAGGHLFSRARRFAAKVKTSLREDHSMFGWADKGRWESAETSDVNVKRERDWFRIGFEPLFADFTKNGSWFLIYTLIEVSSCYAPLRQQLVCRVWAHTRRCPRTSLGHCSVALIVPLNGRNFGAQDAVSPGSHTSLSCFSPALREH